MVRLTGRLGLVLAIPQVINSAPKARSNTAFLNP